jgi:hypothetical protein
MPHTTPAPGAAPAVFYFPGTAALLLRTRTYMSDIAIACWLRNYGASGQPFTVKSTRPGNHHYAVRPSDGGFYISVTRMRGIPG